MTKLWWLGISLSLVPGTFHTFWGWPFLFWVGLGASGQYTVIALFHLSGPLYYSLPVLFFCSFSFHLVTCFWHCGAFPKLDLQQCNGSNPFITRVIFFTCFELQHLQAAAIKFKGEKRCGFSCYSEGYGALKPFFPPFFFSDLLPFY